MACLKKPGMDRCALKKEDSMPRKILLISIACVAGLLFLASSALAAPPNKRICVEVVLQEVTQEPEQPKEEQAAEEKVEGKKPKKKKRKKYPWEHHKPPTLQQITTAGSYLPIGQTPVVYLKRLFEHFITHEKGYEAVFELVIVVGEEPDEEEQVYKETTTLPAGATMLTASPEFTRLAVRAANADVLEELKVEVIAKEASGNQTITEQEVELEEEE